MKVEFDKIGQGCDVCIVKGKDTCPKCERNPGLVQLKDFFKRPPKQLPPPQGLDNPTARVSEQNRSELSGWGVHVPRQVAPVPPPPAGEQKPQGEDGAQAGVESSG